MDLAGLGDGIGFVPVAIGLFGIAELAVTLGRPHERQLLSVKFRDLWPSWAELRACMPAMLRGTALGSVLGVLPGGGAALSSFAAYAVEKKLSRTPEQFGRGAIEGVAAPEAANNAGAQTSFIPLLTLGIPGNAIMALMVGAMMIQGIQPGPAGDDRAAAIVLGRDRVDVARQPDAGRAQPADDRALGIATACALSADVPDDRAVLLHRHLFGW